jgi:hypothetical protein
VFAIQYVCHVVGSKVQLLSRHPRLVSLVDTAVAGAQNSFRQRFASGAIQPLDGDGEADVQPPPSLDGTAMIELVNAVMVQEQAELVALKMVVVAAFPLFHDYCLGIPPREQSLSIHNWLVCVLAITVPLDQLLAVLILGILRRAGYPLDTDYGTGCHNLWHPVQFLSNASPMDRSKYVVRLMAVGLLGFCLFAMGEA